MLLYNIIIYCKIHKLQEIFYETHHIVTVITCRSGLHGATQYNDLTTTSRPPYDHLTTTSRPPHDHLTTTSRPPHDHLTTTSRPPHDHLTTTSRPPHDPHHPFSHLA